MKFQKLDKTFFIRSQAVEGENLNTKDMNFIKRIFGFGNIYYNLYRIST